MDEVKLGKLYDVMLFAPTVMSAISGAKATLKGGYLEGLWDSTENDVYFFANMQKGMLVGEDAQPDVGRALVTAEYCTYIPYAERAAEQLEEKARELGFESLAALRYRRFVQLLDRYIVDVDEETLDAVKAYFENRDFEVVHAGDLREVSCAFCRLKHRFEEFYDTPEWDEDAISDLMCSFGDGEHFDEDGRASMEDILSLAPRPVAPSEEELHFAFAVLTKWADRLCNVQ